MIKVLLGDFMAEEETAQKIPVSPATFVYHTEDEYIMEVELPGVKKEDININITENTFCVRAPRRNTEYNGCWVLAHDFNPDKGSARYENGLLTIRMPLVEERAKKRTEISVK